MDMAIPTSDAALAHITLVHAEACHFCTDASETLGEMATEFALDVHAVNAASDEGRALIAEHRPAMSPLVLLDGAFFSHGRLPRKKLSKLLTERASTMQGARHGI